MVDIWCSSQSLHEVSATCVFLDKIDGFVGAFFALMLFVVSLLRHQKINGKHNQQLLICNKIVAQ